MWTNQKQVLLSLIDMYKDMTYLWNKDHKDYLNRDMREEGFSQLLKLYRNYDEHATVKNIKKKIENMRTNCAKELKKVLSSEQAGEEYVPTLWYYHAMSFLGNRADSGHNVTDSDPLNNVETSLDYDDDSVSSASASSAKRMKREPFIQKQILHIPKSPERIAKSQNDERWKSYGKTIGYQVKDLSEHQLVICQKLISDAIFYAKLNKLNENSHIVNPDVIEYLDEDGNI